MKTPIEEAKHTGEFKKHWKSYFNFKTIKSGLIEEVFQGIFKRIVIN